MMRSLAPLRRRAGQLHDLNPAPLRGHGELPAGRVGMISRTCSTETAAGPVCLALPECAYIF